MLTAFTAVTVLVTEFTSRFFQPLNEEAKEEFITSNKELSDMLIQKFPTFTVSFNEEKKFQSVADTWPSSLNCDNSKKYWKFSSNMQLEDFLDNIIDKAK